MKKTIFVLGNSLNPSDSLPLKLLPRLRQLFPEISFEMFDPTEEIPHNTQENLVFIDTVIGAKKVKKFNNFTAFALSPRNTVHDFDLPISLGILKKLGKIKKVTLIGIPPDASLKKTLFQLKKILRKIISSPTETY